MVQFYLLSVLLNVLVGLILVYAKNYISDSSELSLSEDFSLESDSSASRDSDSENDAGFLNNSTFRLVVGIAALFVGFMKILSVYNGDVPVLGDIIPAATGIVGSAILLLEYYTSKASVSMNLPDFVSKLLREGRRYVGIACIIAALLHFVCPKVPLL